MDITTPSGGTANVAVADPLAQTGGGDLSIGTGVTLTVPSEVNMNVSSGANLNIDSGATLINDGGTITIDNTSTLTNDGTIENNAGTITNSGTLNNSIGTIDNSGGSITNTTAGTINNNNEISNNSPLINEGTLNNASTGTIDNNGAISNSGTVNNSGAINNWNGSTLDNTNQITNSGTLEVGAGSTLTNNGTIINNGTASNYGTINNSAGETIINNGTLTNNSGATINNDGTIVNNGTLTDNGTLAGTGSVIDTPAPGATVDISVLVDGQACADGSWSYNNGVLTVNNGANVALTGTNPNLQIVVNGTADVAIQGVSITGPDNGESPITLNSGATLNLTVDGVNTLTPAAPATAGINDPAGTTLNITGSGILFDGSNGTVVGDYTLGSDLTIPSGTTLEIPNGATLTTPTSTTLSNNGDIVVGNGGTLVADGTLDNTRTVTNNGTITNNGVLDNTGTIINNGTFDNTGTVTGNGTFTNNGVVTGDDSFLPTTSISLSISGTYDFGSVQVGADVSLLLLDVTITNDGEVATGDISIDLSGNNADSFTVSVVSAAVLSINAFALSTSAATIPSIAPGGTATFTVAPNAGLSAGTYTATVTVSGMEFNPQAFDVSFTVLAAASTPTITVSSQDTTRSYGQASGDVTFTITDANFTDTSFAPAIEWDSGSAPAGVTDIAFSSTSTSDITMLTMTVDASTNAGTYGFTIMSVYGSLGDIEGTGSLVVGQAVAASIATSISDPASITAYDARNATDIAGIIALANLPSTVDVNLQGGGTATLAITWSSASAFNPLGTTYTITGGIDSTANVDVSSLTMPYVTFTVNPVTATNPTFTNTSVQVNINRTTPQTPSDLGTTALPTSGSTTVGDVSVPHTIEWTGTLDVTAVGNSATFTGTVTHTSPPAWLTIPSDLSVSRTVTVTDCTHDLMFELPWIVRLEPTCTANGEEYRQCPTCGYEETQPIPALGHDYSEEYTQTLAPTCTTPGKESRVCTRCGDRIDERDIPALGHTWSSWTVTTAPTATTAGVETRTCAVCGATETRPIPATGAGTSTGSSGSNVIIAPVSPDYESDDNNDTIIAPQIPWNRRDRDVVTVPATPTVQTVTIVNIIATGGTNSKIGGKLDISAKKENGAVNVELDPQTKNQLIDYAQKTAKENMGEEPIVKLDLSGVEDAKAAMLSTDAFDAFAKANVGLKIALPNGSIEFSKEALESTVKQAKDEYISVMLEKKSKADLSQQQQGAISDNDAVFGIRVSSGNKTIAQFDGDLTISAQYTGKLPAAIWQLSGEEEALHQQYEYGPLPAEVLQPSNTDHMVRLYMTYDPVTQAITFVTNHLTPFFVAGYIGSGSPWVRLTIGEKAYTVNGTPHMLDVAPVIINDRAMVPIRFIAEALGAYVNWDTTRRAAVLELDGLTITIFIGELAPGMDVPAMIINDRTVVPLRFVSEALGASVYWYPGANTIDIVVY